MTLLLMRVSGITLLEDGLKALDPGYHAYIARTLLPMRTRHALVECQPVPPTQQR